MLGIHGHIHPMRKALFCFHQPAFYQFCRGKENDRRIRWSVPMTQQRRFWNLSEYGYPFRECRATIWGLFKLVDFFTTGISVGHDCVFQACSRRGEDCFPGTASLSLEFAFLPIAKASMGGLKDEYIIKEMAVL